MTAVVAGLALLLLVVATAGDVYSPLGNADPGPLTTYGFAVVRFMADAAAAGCFGGLVFAAFVALGRRGGSLSADAYAASRFAAGSAACWLAAAVVAVPFSAASASGLPVSRILRPEVFLPTFSATEEPRAWLCVAVAAAVTTALAWPAMAWRTVVAATVTAGVGLLPLVAVGHVSVGAGHDLATNALFWHVPAATAWLGALVALLARSRRGPIPELTLVRYRRLSLMCFVVTALSGAVAGFALPRPDGLLSRYGLVLGLETALLVAAGFGIAVWRRRRFVVAELVLLALGTGGSAALTALVPPAFVNHPATVQETVLGYGLDAPQTLARLVGDWRPDLLFLPLALIAVTAYLLGVRRLRRRGDHWPPGRVVAWVAGWVIVVVVTSSGLGVYAPGTFSLHMVTHMALNMFAPVLLVLGGPVTLALRALPANRDVPGAREWIASLLHAPVTRFFAHPAVAAILFAGSFYALYFSGLFGQAMLYHWAHQLMKVHFLVTGYLFAWVAVGADRTPRQVPHLARLGMLFAVMPFHAFFGVILMSKQALIAGTYYHYLALPWAGDLLADQRLGGGIAWASGEIPMVVMVVALLVQWSRDDERKARRADRHGENDLDAYNAMLAELAARRN
ncbi:cytochrome c oxidase assembly protein [Amycolatopsis sp. NBRC 101858]|uniref:cytochrome c oxidase assembly protein n=1 Tax=Amycolatopsis sp. NBRC 101858 TaxID=3032200 RepID=UPI00255499F6|nr:cytochrome c oxidase assembly protein [Amycolatopsis sp. NBRC 101858]